MSIPKLEFPPFHLPAEAEALRGEVRSFLKETLPRVKSEDRFASWNTFSPTFSRWGRHRVLLHIERGGGMSCLHHRRFARQRGGCAGRGLQAKLAASDRWRRHGRWPVPMAAHAPVCPVPPSGHR